MAPKRELGLAAGGGGVAAKRLRVAVPGPAVGGGRPVVPATRLLRKTVFVVLFLLRMCVPDRPVPSCMVLDSWFFLSSVSWFNSSLPVNLCVCVRARARAQEREGHGDGEHLADWPHGECVHLFMDQILAIISTTFFNCLPPIIS